MMLSNSIELELDVLRKANGIDTVRLVPSFKTTVFNVFSSLVTRVRLLISEGIYISSIVVLLEDIVDNDSPASISVT